MQKSKLLVLMMVLLFSCKLFANSDLERVYLVQMLNQLEALKPLMVEASNAQARHNRFHFHYTAYVDSQGRQHNGLADDLSEIERGIKARLNKISSEPQAFNAIDGDYI